MFALVVDGVIIQTGGLPGAARLVSTGQWLCPPGGLAEAAQAEREACGWFAVTHTTRPADTALNTHDYSGVSLVAGTPTTTWTQRPKTQAEKDADTQTTNQATIVTRANNALTANGTFLALGAAPTNVQVRDQVILLTKETTSVIKLLLAQLGDRSKLMDTTGTS